MTERPWKHKNILENFLGALRGIKVILITERYARVIFLAIILVVLLGLFLKVSLTESMFLMTGFLTVIVSEIFNTIIENILDTLSQQQNNRIKILKEMAAAVVLIASLGTAIISVIIFFPKIAALVYSFK